ncbi:BamA/TamA family outer membrane protein [Aureivirga sp. CE67]|uniref:translocation and assembly module lipoprotein TamL n=1 Tax=Aureivirga sp. CE67 TaxID=1788983 RepID=UPI0018C9ACEF|nr:BamA/TamA family outer membrane protein [Aureivirga sp. CE67]
MKNNILISIVFLIASLAFVSCNSVKYVPEGKHLLTKNKLFVDGKQGGVKEANEYIIQRPNQSVLLLKFPLYFYNLGNKGYDTAFVQYLDRHPKTLKFLDKTFSRKQVSSMNNTYKGLNKWFLEKGEAPVILDSEKTTATAKNLKSYFINQGYYKVKIDYKEILYPNKKAEVEYYIEKNTPYRIDSISKDISSKELDLIYQKRKFPTSIKKGELLKLSYFEDERDKITRLFRNNGVYYFDPNSIRFSIDTTRNEFDVNVKLQIANRYISKADSVYFVPYKKQTVSKVKVYTDYYFNDRQKPYKDTLVYNKMEFINHEKSKYNPKLLSNAIFIQPDSLYRDIDRENTRTQIRNLQNFKLVEIRYRELKDSTLEASIYLTPYEKFRLGINTELTHSNVRPFGVSAGVSLLNRNIFKGAEILKLSVQGSFLNSQDAAEFNTFFNAWEAGGDISLKIPRFLLPFKTNKWVSKDMSPKTQFLLATNFQKNIGLDKQNFTGSLTYSWAPNRKNKHSIELLNLQYIRNLNVSSYFNIYRTDRNTLINISDTDIPAPENAKDENGNLIPLTYIDYVLDPSNGFATQFPSDYKSVQNIKRRYDIITEDYLIPAIVYNYNYNNSKGIKDNSFSAIRVRAATAGNLASIFVKSEGGDSSKKLLGIPIAQYAKLDLEYRKFWGFGPKKTLAYRFFTGIALPYGNSKGVPFNKAYYIGGPNDLRAWKVYSLGPGSTRNGLEYNVGNFKILSSLEYRFNVLGSFNGAFFIDAGNIWDITNNSITPDDEKFNGFDSLRDIAIGSGFGMRYDVNFLVIRLDFGFKTYEPYLETNRWFTNYNFKKSVINIGINYPF